MWTIQIGNVHFDHEVSMATTVFLEVSVGVDVAPEALEHWVFAQLNMPGLEKRFSRGKVDVREEDLDAIDEFRGEFEVQRFEPVMAELCETEEVGVNMMEMAAMEEEIDVSWEKRGALMAWPGMALKSFYADGFRAGVAWAAREAQSQASSPTVGTISQYPPATEQPEDEIVDAHRCLVEPDQAWPRR